MMLIDTVTN